MKWAIGIVIGIFIAFNYPDIAQQIMHYANMAIDMIIDLVRR